MNSTLKKPKVNQVKHGEYQIKKPQNFKDATF